MVTDTILGNTWLYGLALRPHLKARTMRCQDLHQTITHRRPGSRNLPSSLLPRLTLEAMAIHSFRHKVRY
jgi:hypothetical protein